MSRRGRAIHRVDLTAKGLQEEAARLGVRYAPADGRFDGVLWMPDSAIKIVDWKSPGADLTPSQVKMVAAGWPIQFISAIDQLHQLIAKHGRA
jgi:hypothetical protein